MKREVTTQEALAELAAAKLKLETMQQLLVLKEQLLSSKDEQINYRFGTHSEKSFEQLSLFDDLDDDFFPEAEMLTNEELQETIEENKLSVKAYKRRKCGRKKIADNLERVPIYACRNCEGSGDEEHPVFRQAPAAKNIIQQGIATPGLLSYIFINKYCNHMPYYRQSKNFERKGIELSRATMDKWQLEVYEKLKPLEKIMLEHVKTGKVLNMDETTTQISAL